MKMFKKGDQVRCVEADEWKGATVYPGDIRTVARADEISFNDTDDNRWWAACFELVPAEPPQDPGLEFLNDALLTLADVFNEGAGPFDRGCAAVLRDLAAAYGKRIQHVNRMELVDVE